MRSVKILLGLIIVMKLVINPLAFAKEKVAAIYDYKITRVIDGDTVAFEANFLPSPLKQELSIRVFGVDTPEKSWRAECETEARHGEEASNFTKKMIKESKVQQVTIIKWDKYGGRVLGDILLDGKSLRMMLLEKGYAREYYGKKKESWCDFNKP